jgi:hypothetical protein
MLRKEELSDPNSCLNRAKDNEMVFVLLERDPAAPVAIRAWIDARNAEVIATWMETHGGKVGK